MPRVQHGPVLMGWTCCPLGRGLRISPYKFLSLQCLHVHGTPWAKGRGSTKAPVATRNKKKSWAASSRWTFAEFAATLRSPIVYLLYMILLSYCILWPTSHCGLYIVTPNPSSPEKNQEGTDPEVTLWNYKCPSSYLLGFCPICYYSSCIFLPLLVSQKGICTAM